MMEMFEWLTAEPSTWATAGKWACAVALTVPVAKIGQLMVEAQRVDQASTGRGEALAEVVPMPRAKKTSKPVAAPAVEAVVTAVTLAEETEETEGAKVLPLLPRAEREALRAGVWS